MKRKPNEEIVNDNGSELLFRSDFSFAHAVNQNDNKRDISYIFQDLASGLLPIDELKHIIMCGLVSENGEPVKHTDLKAEEIINRHGLQQAHQLCYLLLSHILIGEKKSSEIGYEERAKALTESFLNLKSKSSKKVLSLWAIQLTISTVAACTIINVTWKLFI